MRRFNINRAIRHRMMVEAARNDSKGKPRKKHIQNNSNFSLTNFTLNIVGLGLLVHFFSWFGLIAYIWYKLWVMGRNTKS